MERKLQGELAKLDTLSAVVLETEVITADPDAVRAARALMSAIESNFRSVSMSDIRPRNISAETSGDVLLEWTVNGRQLHIHARSTGSYRCEIFDGPAAFTSVDSIPNAFLFDALSAFSNLIRS